MKTDILTADILDEIIQNLPKVEKQFDILLLMHNQYLDLREIFELEPSRGTYEPNSIFGCNFEYFYNKQDLYQRAFELINKGYKVGLLKD